MLHSHATPRAISDLPVGLSSDDLRTLDDLPLFNGLGLEALGAAFCDARVESRPAGALLFLAGDPVRHFHVVLDGWIKLYRGSTDGNESVIAFLSRGESFCELAAGVSATYPVSAAVVDDARLLTVPAGQFLERALSDRVLARGVLDAMARRLNQLVRQVEELSNKTTVERLATYIVALSDARSGAVELRLPVDKALIARHLGMQPETLSRSFVRLRPLGVVADGNRVTVAEIGVLRRLSGAGPGDDPMRSPCARGSHNAARASAH